MSKIKYKNGMYKTTNDSQDRLSQCLFNQLYKTIAFLSMSTNFANETGNVMYTYYYEDNTPLLSIIVDRRGKILT